MIDLKKNDLRMEYKVEQSNMPILIHNDMGVRVYVILKKVVNDFNIYSICASVEKEVENAIEGSCIQPLVSVFASNITCGE